MKKKSAPHKKSAGRKTSSRSASHSNVERKSMKQSHQEPKEKAFQAGFTEPSSRMGSGLDFDESTVGVP